MKINNRLLLATASLAIAVSAASACPFCQEKKVGLFVGETAIMGNGTVRSWIDIAKDGVPRAMGVTFTETALLGLPEGKYNEMGAEYVLNFPAIAKKLTPFDHVGLDWMPGGHEPEPIYGKPHFDFHFYTITTQQRSKITLKGDDLARAKMPVQKGYMPEGYIQGPNTEVPYMGSHWVNLSSPEFAGKPFTSTFIMGSYNGKVNFYEPMVAKAFLESKPQLRAPIILPKIVEKSAWYPTEYEITFDDVRKEHTVAYSKFVWLDAPSVKPVAANKTASKTVKTSAKAKKS